MDSDVKLASVYADAWALRGIETVRTDNMTEAIHKLSFSDKYLYVGINGDAVDFMPMLRTMRLATGLPIFIVSSDFTTRTEVAALTGGADLYGRWHQSVEGNISSVMAHITLITNRAKMKKRAPHTLTCGNLIVLTDHKMVFCDNKEIILTAKEYDILTLLLYHLNINLTTNQIAEEVWGEEVSEEAIWKTIDRLRRKLTDAGFLGGGIVHNRGLGYRVSARYDAQRAYHL